MLICIHGFRSLFRYVALYSGPCILRPSEREGIFIMLYTENTMYKIGLTDGWNSCANS